MKLFIDKDYYIETYQAVDILGTTTQSKNKNVSYEYYIQWASDQVNNLSIIDLYAGEN